MNNVLIKICGIRQVKHVSAAAKSGAQYIGIVFADCSRRFVTKESAREIVIAATAEGIIPVAVFYNQSAEEILNVCDITKIHTVQLHGKLSKSEHRKLPHDLTRFYVLDDSSSSMDRGDLIGAELKKERDFLLFDNKNPGGGKAFDWTKSINPGRFSFGIAGGLNSSNVKTAINHFKPHLVDVSTGVENANGEKETALIKQFIQCVREA